MTSPRTLICHPATWTDIVRHIQVVAHKIDNNSVSLNYLLAANLAQIRVPPLSAAERTDGLWRHTCFEAFVNTGSAAYLEFNLSPATRWAAYRFTGYRAGMIPTTDIPAPEITVRLMQHGIALNAVLHLGHDAPIRLALSAVIELANGTCSYWALHHPPGKPDFHHPDNFTLIL